MPVSFALAPTKLKNVLKLRPNVSTTLISVIQAVLMQLYCLYYTDEGHCIVDKTFGLNFRTFFWLVREQKKLAAQYRLILVVLLLNNALKVM